jgi:hypothetical protein
LLCRLGTRSSIARYGGRFAEPGVTRRAMNSCKLTAFGAGGD